MLPRFSIQLFSQTVHKAEVSDLAQALFDRLPETDMFFVTEWSRQTRSPREFVSFLDEHAHLLICMGSPSFWGEMIGLEDLERWVAMGKTVLWLHLPPPENPDEPAPSVEGIEVLPHEVWARINPVIDRIIALADETRIERKFRQMAMKRQESNPYGRDPRGKYSVALDQRSDPRQLTNPLELQWQHRHWALWNVEREENERRWNHVEENARSEGPVSTSIQTAQRQTARRGRSPDEAAVTVVPNEENARLSTETLVAREPIDKKGARRMQSLVQCIHLRSGKAARRKLSRFGFTATSRPPWSKKKRTGAMNSPTGCGRKLSGSISRVAIAFLLP